MIIQICLLFITLAQTTFYKNNNKCSLRRMSKTIHRLIQFINHKNLSARKFDISIGTANGYTLRMQKNNASVGSDVIERIVRTYPQLNLIWLITGKGDMLLPERTKESSKSKAEIEGFINDKLNEKWSAEKKALLDEILKEIRNANI